MSDVLKIAYLRDVLRKGVGLFGLCLLGACEMDSEDSARDLTLEMTHPGNLVYFESRQTCTAAVYQAIDGETKFNVPITDMADDALDKANRRIAIAFDDPDTSPNDFTRYAASNRAPASMRIVAAGTAALKCMPDDVQAAYFAALTTPSSVTVIDMKQSALVIVDRMTGHIFTVRGDL